MDGMSSTELVPVPAGSNAEFMNLFANGPITFGAVFKIMYDRAAKQEPYIPPVPVAHLVCDRIEAGQLRERSDGKLEKVPATFGALTIQDGGTPLRWVGSKLRREA